MTRRVPGRVSIVVPTRNRQHYLSEALASACAQRYPDIEILVGDNASTDETPAVVRELAARDARVRYVRHETDLGMVGNWNALVRLATGEYFVLLSDDDVLMPGALDRLVAACAAPSVMMAYGGSCLIDGGGHVLDLYGRGGPPVERGDDFITAHLRGERTLDLAGTLYRTPREDVHELFSEDVGLVCDLVHRLETAIQGDVGFVPLPPVALYREHDSNLTLRAAAFAQSLFRVLEHPSVRHGALARFAPAIHACVVAKVDDLATRAAARGRRDAAIAMLRILDERAVPTARLRWRMRVLDLPPVRLATALRRRWLRRRAAGQARLFAPDVPSLHR